MVLWLKKSTFYRKKVLALLTFQLLVEKTGIRNLVGGNGKACYTK